MTADAERLELAEQVVAIAIYVAEGHVAPAAMLPAIRAWMAAAPNCALPEIKKPETMQ